MPSRRPPSQRDPAYALHRLPGTLAQVAAGLKVKNASPVKQRTPNRTVAATVDGRVVIPVLHGDPATLVEGLIWFDLDASC